MPRRWPKRTATEVVAEDKTSSSNKIRNSNNSKVRERMTSKKTNNSKVRERMTSKKTNNSNKDNRDSSNNRHARKTQ